MRDRGRPACRGACHRARIRATRWLMRATITKHNSASPRHLAPEFCKFIPPQIEGSREDRVHAAPAISRAWMRKAKRTRAYRFSGGSPAFPAQWCYGLFRTLPGDRAFLPPSPPRSLLLKNLTPASRCQDHTTSPSANACARLTQTPRPPHPTPRVVTCATPLSSGGVDSF
jgi:hypothetical protein